jgi:hypothetical protein
MRGGMGVEFRRLLMKALQIVWHPVIQHTTGWHTVHPISWIASYSSLQQFILQTANCKKQQNNHDKYLQPCNQTTTNMIKHKS